MTKIRPLNNGDKKCHKFSIHKNAKQGKRKT